MLEGILLGHVAVSDCAVIGVPDAEAGELPRAYVVLKRNAAATEKELQEFVAGLFNCEFSLLLAVFDFSVDSVNCQMFSHLAISSKF